MCSNCNNNSVLGNNVNSFNNPNLPNGTVGLFIENGNNGNNAVFTTNTTPFNNGEVLNTNINASAFNNNNNNSCNCNDNNSCNCNCNGNSSCNCNRNNGCNCNGNNSSRCNWNNNDNDNVTNDTLQENLRNFIGRRVTLEFNICGSCSKKTGILTCVGRNFVTLRGVNNNNCLLCDTAGLNFVTVHNNNC